MRELNQVMLCTSILSCVANRWRDKKASTNWLLHAFKLPFVREKKECKVFQQFY